MSKIKKIYLENMKILILFFIILISGCATKQVVTPEKIRTQSEEQKFRELNRLLIFHQIDSFKNELKNTQPDLQGLNGDSIAHSVVFINDIPLIKTLIDHKIPLDLANDFQQNPLMLAIQLKHTNMAKELIKLYKNINQKDFMGNTALTLAKESGQDEIADLLLKKSKIISPDINN